MSEPGGLCLSRSVRDQVRDKLAYRFEDAGEHEVKNIARPVRVFALSASAVATLAKRRSSAFASTHEIPAGHRD